MVPLKKAREARGLSQRALAQQAKVQQATISQAERGSPVSREQAEKLARFFGHPWEELHFLYPERYLSIDQATSAPEVEKAS